VFLALTWLLLTRWLYRPEIDEIPGGRELIQRELDELGPVSRGERLVGIVFVGTALGLDRQLRARRRARGHRARAGSTTP
jgi:di/tricarboxylate transporter